MDEQRKWFLEMESTSGEDAGKIVEITRDLEYYTNLPDKAVDGSRGLTSNLKEVRSEERRVGKECRSRWSPYH